MSRNNIRTPHSTPQTIEVLWDREPKQYRAQCNRKGCHDEGNLRYSMGRAQADARTHEKVKHQ